MISAAVGCNNGTTVTPVVTPTPATSPTLAPPGTPTNLPVLTVTSTSFANGGSIPGAQALVGCGNSSGLGANISTDVAWTAGPAGTASYVLTEFDTDAPTGVGFWHWTIFNIPPSVTSLALNAAATPPAGSIQGYNDYGFSGYGGPCPPVGDPPHHYYFTVSALNSTLSGVTSSATGAFLTFNMRGKIIAQGQLLGRYGR